jgi:hypothetical protein
LGIQVVYEIRNLEIISGQRISPQVSYRIIPLSIGEKKKKGHALGSEAYIIVHRVSVMHRVKLRTVEIRVRTAMLRMIHRTALDLEQNGISRN